MPSTNADLNSTVFAKTETGQREIATRALGLNPMARRLLILVDGKRYGKDLAPMVAGHDLADLLTQLMDKSCIEIVSVGDHATQPKTDRVAPSTSQESAGLDAYLARLPAAETRTPKDVESARNFMMNTVNTVFQQNTRLTLMEAIFSCKTTEDVRRVYLKWAETMSSSSIGAKRLPDFQEKLSKVL